MVKMKSITITRAEGPSHLCDKPHVCRTWREADLLLASMARTAPAHGGYDKTDFQVVWESGEEYQGRFDLERKHTSGGPMLEEHIQHFLGFLAGTYRPPHMIGGVRENNAWARAREAFREEEAGAKAALAAWSFAD